MSRILRRPMFRMGGSANSKGTGITSGLERKGYAEAGSVDIGEVGRQFEELQKIKEQYGIKPPEAPPTGMGLSDWLDIAGTGLELAFKPGVRTGEAVAEVIPGLLQRTGQRLEAKKEKARGVEETLAGMKSADIESIYKTEADRALEKLKGQYGKDSVFRDKLMQLELDYNRAMQEAGNDEATKTKLTAEYYAKRDKIITDADVIDYKGLLVENLLKDDDIRRKISSTVKSQLEEEGIVETADNYLDEYTKRMYEAGLSLVEQYGYKKGGRVGKVEGGMMTQPVNTNSQTNANVAETPTGLSYDLVRARIPKEVSDDIVRLIVQSPAALEDFASIETQLDVDSFNQKYNVNLVLPQSGV